MNVAEIAAGAKRRPERRRLDNSQESWLLGLYGRSDEDDPPITFIEAIRRSNHLKGQP